jgi:16S rRNA processing protein RimM
MSRHRINVPIFGLTTQSVSQRKMALYRNVTPLLMAKFDDRDAAESLVRAILWIDQDEQSTPDEEDAWFDHQLVGLDVVRDGVVVGRVARVDHLPAQDLLAVAVGENEVLVPFVKAIVPEVDPAAGRVVVTPPAGLFEELPADDESTAEDETAATGED